MVAAHGDARRGMARSLGQKQGQERKGLLNKLLTRRTAVKGALGLGALAAVTGTTTQLAACTTQEHANSAGTPQVLEEGSATSITEAYTYQEDLTYLTPSAQYSLPLGTVFRPAEGAWLPATTTTSSAGEPVAVSALNVNTGELKEVLAAPQSAGSNYVFYDVHCSDSVYAWVEYNTVSKAWALWAAPFAAGALAGDAVCLWEASEEYDPAQAVASGDAVIFQVMPAASGTKSTESSYCYVWRVGDAAPAAVVESPGRFACEPSVSQGVVTLVPRVNADQGVFYGIRAYTLRDNLATIVDTLVLPQSIKPMTAVRMGERFAFQIEATYASGGLFANMGTYIGGSDGPFVELAREPVAAVAGLEDVFIIKSKSSYVIANTTAHTYETLTAQNRAQDHGEFPARIGVTSQFVTFCTVKDATTGYPANVVVRIFAVSSE